MQFLASLLIFLTLVCSAYAQFQFFEQMFNQGGGGGGGGGGQRGNPYERPAHQQEAPSDSEWYRGMFTQTLCEKYLCPETLSCVHFPHHCPCPWPSTEDKVELGDGAMVCASKGGYKKDESIRKIELARKGLL